MPAKRTVKVGDRVLKNARRFSPSSQKWLQRQINDPYVVKAKAAGWRSRAAFKLIELDEKYHLLKSGQRIVDLGAAPGGWTQVALKKVGAKGQVVGIDILPMEPIAGATLLLKDFTEEDAPALLLAELGGPVDLVLSDMAAGSIGHQATDHLRIMMLAEMGLEFAIQVLKPGGGFVCKLFQGGAEKELLTILRKHFSTVKHAKPPASRQGSSETYVVALGFKAPEALGFKATKA